jgi:hypothetical protein
MLTYKYRKSKTKLQALQSLQNYMKERQLCEVCKTNTFLNEHHIHSTSLGGNDKPYNIARLCPTCHNEVHFGALILEGRFVSSRGNIIVWRRQGEKSITGLFDPPVWLYNQK